jgi:hypothetical protein
VTEPAILYAEHIDDLGQAWSLALVRTRWANEGQCVLECTNKAGVSLVEQGAWSVAHDDDGPALLRVEIPMDDELNYAALNLLLGKLVAKGGSWGIESHEVLP